MERPGKTAEIERISGRNTTHVYTEEKWKY